MKELTGWIAVTDWKDNTRFGTIDLPKEEAAIVELVNGEGHVFRWDDDPEKREVCNGFNPPYTPTKWVYGRVFLQEFRVCTKPDEIDENRYARKLLKLTEDSVIFETCAK